MLIISRTAGCMSYNKRTSNDDVIQMINVSQRLLSWVNRFLLQFASYKISIFYCYLVHCVVSASCKLALCFGDLLSAAYSRPLPIERAGPQIRPGSLLFLSFSLLPPIFLLFLLPPSCSMLLYIIAKVVSIPDLSRS